MVIEFLSIEESDYDTLIRWGDSPELLQQWTGGSWSYPLDVQQLHQHFLNTDPKRECYKAVQNGEMVGYLELGNIDKRNDSATVMRVIIGPEFRGMALGTKMMQSLLDVAFTVHELHRVSLHVFDFNTAAIRCYEKAGFRREGLLRDAYKFQNGYWSAYAMSILRYEWEKQI